MTNIFIDLETFGDKPEEKELILPTGSDIKVGNIKDPLKIEEKIKEELPKLIVEAKAKHAKDHNDEWRGNALKSTKCSVIAISFAINDEPVINLKGDEFDIFNQLSVYLIDRFGQQAASLRIVSHNGSGFDWPIIRHRCIKYGLLPLYHVFTASRYNERMYDTQEVWRGSDFKSYYSLDAIAKFLGIEGKTTMTGKDVHDYYLAGKLEEISLYCGHDVEVLRNVFNKLNFK